MEHINDKIKVSEVMFELLRFEINGTEISCDTKNSITPKTLFPLIKLSKMHDLSHLIVDALDRNGLLLCDDSVKKRLLFERDFAICRYEQQEYELQEFCKILESEKIPFVPLKGSVLKKYYPEPWMRTSCDIDVLLKREDVQSTIKILVERYSYRCDSIGEYDVQIYSDNGAHFELHFGLTEITAKKEEKKIFENVWENVVGIGYQKELTDEMFYCYHISHIAKHLKYGGCGARSILDTLILNENVPHSSEKREQLLAKAGLLKLAKTIEKVARVWFLLESEDDLSKRLSDYIVSGGVYGAFENKVAAQTFVKKNKFSYLFSRIFIPYSEMKFKYPILQKCPILYPIYVVKRWFLMLNKNKRALAKKELNQTIKKNEKQEEIIKLLKELEI